MHRASDTISRTAIGRLRAKELPVDAEALIYERILRLASPILPLLAQDCGLSQPELSLFVAEGDLSLPKIPPALDSRREIESSHDWGRCSIVKHDQSRRLMPMAARMRSPAMSAIWSPLGELSGHRPSHQTWPCAPSSAKKPLLNVTCSRGQN